MLELENVQVSIGEYTILRGVSLAVPAGEIVGLVGRNGAGKTTTLKSTMGLVAVRSGTIRLDGHDLLRAAAEERARLGIGYMPEDRRLISSLRVDENILLPLWATGADDLQERLDWVYEQIPEVRAFAERRATQLSGGEQKLVALARALVVGTRFLLLDEPFEGLATDLAERLAEVIQVLGAQGRGVLVAESDAERARSLADATYTIERGTVQNVTFCHSEAPRNDI